MVSTYKNTLWKFVNSAFGIWLLSTIVIGGLSFGYTLWKEHQNTILRNQLELQSVLEEGKFRIANLDTAMANASLSMAPLFSLIYKKQDITPLQFQKRLEDLFILTATIRLAGLTSVPPLYKKENYKVLNKNYTLSDTPFGQANKFPKYENYSLLDLSRIIHRLENGSDMPKETYYNLKLNLDELLYFSDLYFVDKDIENILEKGDQLSQVELKESFLSVATVYVNIKEHLDDNVRYRKELEFFDNHGSGK